MPTSAPDAIERLIRIEAKVDSHLFRTTKNEEQLLHHDGRIRNLETGQARTLGIAAGVSAAITALGAWFTNFYPGAH